MNKLINAINFATIAHRNQRRKDEAKTPYINHPIEVMTFLSNAGVTDVDTLCAAVLHDTIEDVGVTHAQLCELFGENVANIVRECSDNKSLPKEVRKQEQIIHARHASLAAKLVKAADKLSNLSGLDTNPPTKWTKEEIEGYFCWSYAVWRETAGHNSVLDEKLLSLFKKRQLTELSEDELQYRLVAYYTHIKMSE
ncbi:putative guanosine-3' 5'-bis(diphosphate) 3'-pyrophosphohydrolase MESH1 [Tupanvirus deep ocean]|uniref:Guanosine-3' 5'-bis(Diphosphate) 3'-pyrophosphohydrolase MESH1 n=2 Tax=Tupanvirus TaxID=2094720 RepID=A0AC62A9U4_9VIRU|nr:putative guanosine-3' 5'-bis(diphosphate) 3'-pyrophosphohydrolase MESH1 [Tupanvirus deep ocean]QKU34520.1 putative guanosine-3' 5'-bis(diphosphate) 3'-pyrophosphohydrolase MESH1 [Tupanvirus deep ocean]